MPAVLSPEEIERGGGGPPGGGEGRPGRRGDRHRAAVRGSIGRTHEEANRRFRASQLYKHLESLKTLDAARADGRLRAAQPDRQPGGDRERIRVYEQAGVTTLSGMLFVAAGARDAGGDRAVRPRGHPQFRYTTR